MKILYISQYYPPEMGAPAARVSELSRLWAGAGHQVTVLTGFPNHPTGVIPREYRRAFRHVVAREMRDGVNVVRTWLLPFANRKTYERILNYSSFCLSAASAGLFLSRPDVVIATSPQLLVGVAGLWISQSKSVPFIFEVRDLWPESLEAVGIGSEASFMNRCVGGVARTLYRRADRVVIVSPAFEKVLTDRWQVPAEKISLVENAVDTDLFTPQASGEPLRQRLGIADRFVVSYIGTMGMAHGLDTVVEAAAQIQHPDPRVLFLLLGEGADKDRILAMARSRGVSNMLFLDAQPRERIPAYIAASDVCLVSLKKAELFKTVIPTKMLEFMSCARPVILSVDGQARRILDAAQAGIHIEPGNADQLTQAVTLLANNRELGEIFGRNGRQHILKHFSRERTAETYLKVLSELIAVEPRVSVAA